MTADLAAWLRQQLDADEAARLWLADIAAKRESIDLHSGRPGYFCRDCDGPVPCPTLRLLACPYRDRPGWHNEWDTP